MEMETTLLPNTRHCLWRHLDDARGGVYLSPHSTPQRCFRTPLASGHGPLALTAAGNRGDRNGERVQPGIYLCRVDLGAEAGEDTAVRSLVVAY